MCYDFKFVRLHHAHQGMVPRHSGVPGRRRFLRLLGVTICLTGNLGVVSAGACGLRPENIASERRVELPAMGGMAAAHI